MHIILHPSKYSLGAWFMPAPDRRSIWVFYHRSRESKQGILYPFHPKLGKNYLGLIEERLFTNLYFSSLMPSSFFQFLPLPILTFNLESNHWLQWNKLTNIYRIECALKIEKYKTEKLAKPKSFFCFQQVPKSTSDPPVLAFDYLL